MWVLKVDISILNHHCKPADWLADWLTDWMRHLCTQGAQALEHVRHSKGTWTLGNSRHSKGTWVLQHSVYLCTWCTRTLEEHLGTQEIKALGHSRGTWALGHSGTWVLVGCFGTRALWHSGTWALKVLKELYLVDSFNKFYFYINKVRVSFLIFNILIIKSFHHENCPQSCVVYSFILKVLLFLNIWSNSFRPFR